MLIGNWRSPDGAHHFQVEDAGGGISGATRDSGPRCSSAQYSSGSSEFTARRSGPQEAESEDETASARAVRSYECFLSGPWRLEDMMAGEWHVMKLDGDLGKEWVSHESHQADVRLILVSTTARRMRKPQPHGDPLALPLRKGYLMMRNQDMLSLRNAPGWLSPRSSKLPLMEEFNVQIGLDVFSAKDADGQ
ncbi:unnamed protein product, partial [Effrenium voratum]